MQMSRSRVAVGAVAVAALLVLNAAGCSREKRADATSKAKDAMAETRDRAREVYADSKAAVTSAWDDLKSYSYEKRAEFTAATKVKAAEMRAEASRLRAEYSDAKASASRKAAMTELKNSEANYQQKLDALGDATEATWESAKNNVISAKDRLEVALRNASKER
jgi:hypothetical protein